jgi:CheY-like chemotaxis protein
MQSQPAILLIDDNAIQAATRQTILRRAGYFVLAALNPQRALEQLRDKTLGEEIGLVITDHIMPIMNGCEFVKHLRQVAPTLPVLVISGMAQAECEYDGMNVHFRVKPLPPPELLELVKTILGEGTATLGEVQFEKSPKQNAT